MKERFEANVASDMPKTRLREPGLPWKLTEDDLGQIAPKDGEIKSVISGTSPLRTRPQFLIMLVVTIFGIGAYLISNAILENENMRGSMAKKESELSLMHISLLKASAEKEAIAKSSVQLEKKVSDLTAQKQLFAGVIETLTKKSDDIDAPPVEAVQSAPGSAQAKPD